MSRPVPLKTSNMIRTYFIAGLLASTLFLGIILLLYDSEEMEPLKERTTQLEIKSNLIEDYQEICIKEEKVTEKQLIDTRINLFCMSEKTFDYFNCLSLRENVYEICMEYRGSQYANITLAEELGCLELAHYENITKTYCLEKSLVKKVKEEIN